MIGSFLGCFLWDMGILMCMRVCIYMCEFVAGFFVERFTR